MSYRIHFMHRELAALEVDQVAQIAGQLVLSLAGREVGRFPLAQIHGHGEGVVCAGPANVPCATCKTPPPAMPPL